MYTSDPKVIGLAFLGGMIPALFWLWFWLKEEKNKVEPKGLLSVVFLMGMLAVVCVIPIQKLIHAIVADENLRLVLWASSEEIIKFLAVILIIYKTDFVDEPLDWPIYMITAAMGFAALENTLFLIKPLSADATIVSLLTGQLRFLGSTLLHAVASGIMGIGLGISIYMTGFKRYWHVFVGIILAIALHSIFNFFIIRNNGNDFIRVFGFLWVVTIIVMLLFEKVRRMK